MTAENLIEKLAKEILDSISQNAELRMRIVNLISDNKCENCQVESLEILTELLESEVIATNKFKNQIKILTYLNEQSN